MADIEKDLHELRREVLESRNLVIKTDNLLKNLQADVKAVARKQEASERRGWANGATAYILFMTLAALGAYMYARGAIERGATAVEEQRTARLAAESARDGVLETQAAAKTASQRALALYEQLVGPDEAKREKAVEQALALEPAGLTELELRAVRDGATRMRQAAADAALESGRAAFNRREYETAATELARHWKLAPKGPEEIALLLLGQSRHSLKQWKGAVEALEAFLKVSPSSRSADYVTLIYGESLAEAGETEKAIAVYRQGAEKFSDSQFAPWMRTRARRLEQAAAPAAPAAPAAAPE